MAMTEEQIRRVKAALADTQAHLAREMAYQPKNRKQDRIAFYESHITKLRAMLEGKEAMHAWASSPRPPDYEDEITPETISRLNRIVPDDEFSERKIISGPAW